MASTNKTPHLGLCQWVETDPLLMDDMNDTLEKIDSAIEERGRKKLLDMTVSEATSSVTLDFSEMPMDEYAELEFIFDFASVSGKYLFLNGSNGYSYYAPMTSTSVEKIPVENGMNRLSIGRNVMSYHPSEGLGYYRIVFNNPPLKSARVFMEGNGRLAVGDHISVWGLRK